MGAARRRQHHHRASCEPPPPSPVGVGDFWVPESSKNLFWVSLSGHSPRPGVNKTLHPPP